MARVRGINQAIGMKADQPRKQILSSMAYRNGVWRNISMYRCQLKYPGVGINGGEMAAAAA
jgi:hypothetical protein